MLLLFGGYAASMGIVFDASKIYPLEWAIMALVFVISILPTFICMTHVAKKDIIRN